MSRRSHRFRASVDIPELGTVVVRGLGAEALAPLTEGVTPSDVVHAREHPNARHPAVDALIVAGCVRPRLSLEQVDELSETSRNALAGAILAAHPLTRSPAEQFRIEEG